MNFDRFLMRYSETWLLGNNKTGEVKNNNAFVFTWTRSDAAGWADGSNDGDTRPPAPRTMPGKRWPTLRWPQ